MYKEYTWTFCYYCEICC